MPLLFSQVDPAGICRRPLSTASLALVARDGVKRNPNRDVTVSRRSSVIGSPVPHQSAPAALSEAAVPP